MDWDASKQALINVYQHQIKELEKAIEDLLPAAMSYYSEYYFAATWLTGLEEEAPALEPSIHNAARLINKIPTTLEPKGDSDWDVYPKPYTKNAGE